MNFMDFTLIVLTALSLIDLIKTWVLFKIIYKDEVNLLMRLGGKMDYFFRLKLGFEQALVMMAFINVLWHFIPKQ